MTPYRVGVAAGRDPSFHRIPRAVVDGAASRQANVRASNGHLRLLRWTVGDWRATVGQRTIRVQFESLVQALQNVVRDPLDLRVVDGLQAREHRGQLCVVPVDTLQDVLDRRRADDGGSAAQGE